MPLDTQQGEVADRLRRFFRTVGRIPASLDEVTVPVALLATLDRAPYRGSPSACAGIATKDGAVAPNLNWAGVRVPTNDAGCLLVHAVEVYPREALAAAAVIFSVTLAVGTGALTDFGPMYSVEPVSSGGPTTVQVIPPRMVNAASTLAALTGASIFEGFELIASSTGRVRFPIKRPILLLQNTWCLANINVNDVAGNPVECGVSIWGEYFNTVEPVF